MPEEIEPRQNTITVPEKYFLKWLNTQSSIARLKIWCDLVKEALPYLTMFLVFLLVIIFPRPEVVAMGATLIALAFRISKKL
jgi:hypothetical protein